MGRGNTGLDNYEYDSYLAKNKREKDLMQRKADRKSALKSDHSGYSFGIDRVPVKVSGIESYRQELKKRGLVIAQEAKKDPNWSIKENARREQERRDREHGHKR